MKPLTKYGHYQRECHKIFLETFPHKRDAYKWLKENFGFDHFSEIPTGDPVIQKIWAALILHPNNALEDL